MAETYKMEADKVRSIMGEAGIAQMKEDMAVQELSLIHISAELPTGREVRLLP